MEEDVGKRNKKRYSGTNKRTVRGDGESNKD